MMKSRQSAADRRRSGGPAQPPGDDRQLAPGARAPGRALVDGFKQHDLLTYSSAISFQILTAIIPFAMFALALAGLLHVSSLWRDHLEPQIRANVSPPVFAVINNAVNNVFHGRRVLWATFGGVLTLWQVSGAVRAVMGALARIYGAQSERPFLRRYSVSFILSIEVAGCFILAALCLLLAPFFAVAHPPVAWRVFAFLVRWTLTVALLWIAVGLLVRHAPGKNQPLPWVTVGAMIVIACWVIVSLAFYFYLTQIASYESVFGSLASVIVALAYLYSSTTVFLFGAQVDAIIRLRTTGARSGLEQDGDERGDERR